MTLHILTLKKSSAGSHGAIPGSACEGGGLQSHGPSLFSEEWSAAWLCHLLAPALPAEERWDARRDPPPLVDVDERYRVGDGVELVVVENQLVQGYLGGL